MQTVNSRSLTSSNLSPKLNVFQLISTSTKVHVTVPTSDNCYMDTEQNRRLLIQAVSLSSYKHKYIIQIHIWSNISLHKHIQCMVLTKNISNLCTHKKVNSINIYGTQEVIRIKIHVFTKAQHVDCVRTVYMYQLSYKVFLSRFAYRI